jgi:hypothetical protein
MYYRHKERTVHAASSPIGEKLGVIGPLLARIFLNFEELIADFQTS